METLEQWIVHQYDTGKSAYEICEELNKCNPVKPWYPNKVVRLLRKCGYEPRSKSEAQSNTLKKGRSPHPTEGTKRSQSTRLKISQKVSETYRSDPLNRERRCAESKIKWSEMSDAKKEDLRSRAAKAVRAAAEYGSKVEQFIWQELRRMGLKVIAHSKTIIPKQSLEVDIFLPELNLVIEIDGLAHREAIWGDKAYEKQKKADMEKNGLVLMHYNMIRIEARAKKFTQAYGRRVWERLKPTIEYIQNKGGIKLEVEERFFYIREEV